ncbi:MAG TPA: hypothetical protein VFD13_07925 [Candidatus Kapabacteria bacterium]|nr:hypothetical protein [Candidatus Kapabacteria bacterium]
MSLLFFTFVAASPFVSSKTLAQVVTQGTVRIGNRSWGNTGNILNGGSLEFHGHATTVDSALRGLKELIAPAPSKHYFEKDGRHYYLDIVPPTMKSKEVDHSKVWLLGAK